MQFLCCLCELCYPQEEPDYKMALCLCIICCFKGYKENISGNRKRLYKFLNVVLVLIFAIVGIVLTSIILSKTILSSSQLTGILENWQLGVFIDIQIQEFCPSNYEVLTNYQIPGTVEGCICLDDKEIETDQCSDWQKLNGCYNQKPQDPIELFQWVQPTNNTFQTIQICGLRSELKFYDLLQNKITTEEDCKTNGYKVCQTQSPENFYCVLKDESCPIRDIILSQNQLSDYDLEQNNLSLIYDNGFYAYTSLVKETTPLLSMAIVKGKGICFDRSQLSLNSKLTEDYILFTPTSEDCILDNSYYQISATNEKMLFQGNNIFSLVKSERPLYNISSNIEYKLLAQNQIYYKVDCRVDNFQYLIDLEQKFHTLNQLVICQLVFSSFFLCVVLIIFTNELHRCFYNDCPSCYSKVQVFIQEISLYLFGITVIVNYSFLIDLALRLEQQGNRNCLQQDSQERINLIYNGLTGTPLSLSYCLLINVCLMILIDFLMITFICFKHYKSRFRSSSPYSYNNNRNYTDQNYQSQQGQQYQQNPALQQYDEQVNHNKNPQHYYVSNQVNELPQNNDNNIKQPSKEEIIVV